MKKNIAVVYGGNSSEYVISVESGKNVSKTIDAEKYNIYPIEIKGNNWNYTIDNKHIAEINKSDFSLTIDSKQIKFDCIVVAIHGTPGEDGILQSYFDLLDIPYSTCSAMVSALTFHKFYCNNYLRTFGVKMAKAHLVKKNEIIDKQEIIEHLGLPIFVKPNAGGSSFGVSKVKSEDELVSAIEKSLKESNEVILEEFIAGTEVTNGVVKIGKEEIVLPITEIVSKNDFFDYEAKYNPSFSDEITPARLSEELTKKCKEISLKIYKLLNCRGICRIDYILRNEEFYFLEINTVPGATANSIIPKQAKEMNLSLTEVYTKIIENAIEEKKKTNR